MAGTVLRTVTLANTLNRGGGMSPEYGMRASDADRERIVAALERHTAAGRLSLEEFAERVDRALACRTHADLAAVVRDLPAESTESARSTVDHTAGARQLALAFALALLALLVIGVAVVAFR
jgi:RNA polymerase-interacting CarD/CdnL/TRCF family regulator